MHTQSTDGMNAVQLERRVGDVSIGAIGLGTQNLSVPGRPDRETAIATVHAALDSGVTLFDSSDAYTTEQDGQGHNELLVVEALRCYDGDTSHVILSTKGGLIFRDGAMWIRNGKPEYLKEAAKASLKRIGGDALELYHFHKKDPEHDFGDSVTALRDLLDEGIIKRAGISNVDLDEILVAQEILGGRVSSIENHFSIGHRDQRAEMEYAATHGIAYLLWGPLGGLGGAAKIAERHPALRTISLERGVSPQRVALAWELRQSPTVVPIPGAISASQAADSAAAASFELSEEEIALLDADTGQH
ncbi:aldo/keto reductase [Microbacterium sp. TWP3-1-2b2]|uniref:aldo/keto reductase n=1 Tax=Microbacterium sp. TWP3-1-2b2 TaxID=2804651 RepID=UPI003CE7466C